jgi:hypothetical protein
MSFLKQNLDHSYLLTYKARISDFIIVGSDDFDFDFKKKVDALIADKKTLKPLACIKNIDSSKESEINEIKYIMDRLDIDFFTYGKSKKNISGIDKYLKL